MVYGYSRVSLSVQPHDIQIQCLKKEGCIKIIEDVHKGNDVSPKLKELPFEKGDTLKVFSIDRISQDRMEAYDQIEMFVNKGVNFLSIREDLNTENTDWRDFFFPDYLEILND